MSEKDYVGDQAKWLQVGDYLLWEYAPDSTKFGITHRVTGESGVFNKDEFLPYVSAFFGLHF